MLEKMGWSKGKGLGANMDGDQNFVRISHKADQKGIGYADRDDQWTSHENQFSSLLKSLDNGANASADDHRSDSDAVADSAFCGFGFGADKKSKKKKKKSIKDKLSGKSLEEMSKSSGVRVHYRKFTRGKDISRYSEKDLANIFGKRAADEEEAAAATKENEQEAEQPADDATPFNYGITTIATGTTIGDYFRRKKAKRTRPDEPTAGSEAAAEPAESTTNGDEAAAGDVIDVDSLPDAAAQKKSKKKKKKRTRSEANDDDIIVVADSPAAATDGADTAAADKKKKKKKKKSKERERAYDATDEDLNETVITLLDDDSIEVVADAVADAPPKAKKRKRASAGDTEVTLRADSDQPIENSAFFKHLLDTILTVNHSGPLSSTALKQSSASPSTSVQTAAAQSPPMFADTYELNRYQAEMFRFVDLNGFPNANINDLSGYGFSKNIDLKITAKSQDRHRINDLWDYALINKYGKDVIRTKKKQRYSIKTLKKKSLFKAL